MIVVNGVVAFPLVYGDVIVTDVTCVGVTYRRHAVVQARNCVGVTCVGVTYRRHAVVQARNCVGVTCVGVTCDGVTCVDVTCVDVNSVGVNSVGVNCVGVTCDDGSSIGKLGFIISVTPHGLVVVSPW